MCLSIITHDKKYNPVSVYTGYKIMKKIEEHYCSLYFGCVLAPISLQVWTNCHNKDTDIVTSKSYEWYKAGFHVFAELSKAKEDYITHHYNKSKITLVEVKAQKIVAEGIDGTTNLKTIVAQRIKIVKEIDCSPLI